LTGYSENAYFHDCPEDQKPLVVTWDLQVSNPHFDLFNLASTVINVTSYRTPVKSHRGVQSWSGRTTVLHSLTSTLIKHTSPSYSRSQKY